MGEGFSVSLIGITFPVVLTHRHIGSVTICLTVYYCISLPPYSGQCCWHSEGAPFVAYTIVAYTIVNKTPRLSSARMFVGLYRLLLIHCIYVSVTKPTCPAFSAWLNTGAISSMKTTGKAIMLCSYGISINVMCSTTLPIKCWFNVWLQAMLKFELVSFCGNSIRSWQWPWYRSQKERQCQLKVNIMSNRKVMLTKDTPLSSHLAVYVL